MPKHLANVDICWLDRCTRWVILYVRNLTAAVIEDQLEDIFVWLSRWNGRKILNICVFLAACRYYWRHWKLHQYVVLRTDTEFWYGIWFRISSVNKFNHTLITALCVRHRQSRNRSGHNLTSAIALSFVYSRSYMQLSTCGEWWSNRS